MKQRRLWGTALALSLTFATSVHASEGVTEEIVVTGSYIKGSPEDAALPVDVIRRDDLEAVGMPSIIEMVRNLGVTSGNLGETNQFQAGGQGNEGVSTINLRGLGGARTLVLLNGRRHVSTETQGVDISALPTSALARLEILKDGAAALYGSDAIAGVVNMISRAGFEGVELRGSNQFIEDSDGDQEFNGIVGWANDNMNWMFAGEYQHRGRLRIRDREDWALLPQAKNPAGGWSGIGNPARFLPASSGGIDANGIPTPGSIIGAGGPDPNCALLGGAVVGLACQFQFTEFDNLIEEQDTYKAFSEFNWDIGENSTWHVEALYSLMDMPRWNTSPSFPPQSLFGRDRFIAPTHPGLIDFKAQNPGLFTDFVIPGGGGAVIAAEDQGAFTISRALGVAGYKGDAQQGKRRTETIRLATGLEGALFDDELNYSLGVSYSTRERDVTAIDMFAERVAFALDGLGGPGCDPATGTPGVDGCEYYNPFSNAIERSAVNGAVNPQFNPAVANSDALQSWLFGKQFFNTTNDLLVFDAVISGDLDWTLPGGAIGWAAGFQSRNEKFDAKLRDINNLDRTPCPFNDPASIALGNATTLDCASPTGPLAFLAGATESSTSRTIYGLFGELAVPITDTLDIQLALRFEDYGGNVGSTVDPKIAVRWQATDWLALRGSASTTFRGPPQSFLTGRATALQFIAAANAFKAVDTFGNANLEPEEATSFNAGLIVDVGNFYGSLDYWRFDFTDPFQAESAQQILDAYIGNACADGQTGAGTPLCDALRSHVFPLGTPAAGVERIEVNIINGADEDTSGVDFFAEYTFPGVFGGELGVGVEGTYTIEFDSDDFKDINGVTLASGGDFAGKLNTGFAPFTPKPVLKGNLFGKYANGPHNFTYVLHYVDSYEDVRAATIKTLRTIDQHITHDVHYTVNLFDDSTLFSLSVLNLTDEDPPGVGLDQNYDPFTHNPFGIMVKAGVKYSFGGG